MLLKYLQRFHIRIMCSSSPLFLCNYVHPSNVKTFYQRFVCCLICADILKFTEHVTYTLNMYKKDAHMPLVPRANYLVVWLYTEITAFLFISFKFCTIVWLYSVFNPILTAFTIFFLFTFGC